MNKHPLEDPKPQIIENVSKPKNIELRLQLDALFEKCTKKTRECLEHNELKSELSANFPLIQTKFFEDGAFYRGILQNGLRNGQGILYNPLGKEIYNGEWENDEFNGQGIYNIKNANRGSNETDWVSYEGVFKQGKFEGLGKIIKKDGEIIMRFFKNGEMLEDNEGKKDRLNTSLNRINEEEEKSGENPENYDENIENYFKEEFEQMEVENASRVHEEEIVKRLTNDSNENLKELAENLEGGFDDYDLDFIA
jgi:hypothetical protein